MKRRATVSPQVVEALVQARLYLRQAGSGRVGKLRWEALRDAQLKLLINPYLGPVDPDNPSQRQLVVSGYRISYRVYPDTGDSETAGDIRLLAVIGPGQHDVSV